MPSATESPAPVNARKSASLLATFERWNRKLHFYSGLFLIFFLWLFAFTGLLLNHPAWTFHENWQNRKETNYERSITPPNLNATDDLSQARDITKQLQIEGDVLLTTTKTSPNQLVFQVRRPGHFFFINANWEQRRATIRQADVNLWGIMKTLHSFTGNIADDSRNHRDWILTYVWAYAMDAVATGLIFMVLSSIYMWLKFPDKRRLGIIVLTLGCVSCGLFCIGLRWIF
jgi:hypothetical protein